MSKKILSILIVTILLLVCVLNSKVFATNNLVTIDASNTSGADTTGTGASAITITSSSSNNTTNSAGNTANNSVNNLTANTNSNNNAASSYNNTSNSTNRTGLPYTGTNSSVIFIVMALVVSAVYAYKKVRDYNV